MKATYIQKGESLDYKNETDTAIQAGEAVAFGSRIGVAGTTIPPGQVGSIHMEGVYRLPKKPGEAIAAGTVVYYTDEGITAAGGEPAGGAAAESADGGSGADGETKAERSASTAKALAGYTVNAVAESDPYATVKLQG